MDKLKLQDFKKWKINSDKFKALQVLNSELERLHKIVTEDTWAGDYTKKMAREQIQKLDDFLISFLEEKDG